MGRFKTSVLAKPPRHRPLRDSPDLDGRLSGSLAAFKFANSAGFEKMRSDSFRKAFAPHPILLFQKMRGWLSRRTRELFHHFNEVHAAVSPGLHDLPTSDGIASGGGPHHRSEPRLHSAHSRGGYPVDRASRQGLAFPTEPALERPPG